MGAQLIQTWAGLHRSKNLKKQKENCESDRILPEIASELCISPAVPVCLLRFKLTHGRMAGMLDTIHNQK